MIKKYAFATALLVAALPALAQQENIEIIETPESVEVTAAPASLEAVETPEDFEEEGDMIEAPNFTLRDINGKEVSLSDFKGQWVVLDFWATWCRYCIMEFPEMKKAYEEYHPLGLEIISIDNMDPVDTWKSAVEKYQLPWVNLYNPAEERGGGVAGQYGVQGFPTKYIISPEGTLYEVFVGADPAFFEFLKQLFVQGE